MDKLTGFCVIRRAWFALEDGKRHLARHKVLTGNLYLALIGADASVDLFDLIAQNGDRG